MKCLRILSMVMLFTSNWFVVKAAGDEDEFPALAHLAELCNTEMSLIPEMKDAACGTDEQDMQAMGYGPTKERTVYKAELLPIELLDTCYESANEEMKDIVLALQNRGLARINTPDVMLLYGPHGTGKSTLAQVLAQKSKPTMDCWIVHAGGLLNSYKNGSEEALRASLDPLDSIDSNRQCVVLIDEVDVLTDSHDDVKDSNHAVATTLSGILDKVQHKKNMLLVLATNNLDKIPEILYSRLKLKYFKIDLPNQQQRKLAIDYWFNALEKTQFKCEDRTLKVRFMKLFSQKNTETQNNEEYKQYLAKQTKNASYRDIRDLFIIAREKAFKRAVLAKEDIVTITEQDFDVAERYIRVKKQEIEKGLWSSTKKFCKDNPVLAGVIGTAVVTGGALLIHHYWEHLPQMRQNVELHGKAIEIQKDLHKEGMSLQRDLHAETIEHTKFSEKIQLTGLAIGGIGVAVALDICFTGGACTAAIVGPAKAVAVTKAVAGATTAVVVPYAMYYGEKGWSYLFGKK